MMLRKAKKEYTRIPAASAQAQRESAASGPAVFFSFSLRYSSPRIIYVVPTSSVSVRFIITTAASEYRSGPSAKSVGENISVSSCSLKPNRYIPSITASSPARTI